MFGFKLKSTFFKNFRPGDLVKVTRYGIVTLFVFSRYDSDRQCGETFRYCICIIILRILQENDLNTKVN